MRSVALAFIGGEGGSCLSGEGRCKGEREGGELCHISRSVEKCSVRQVVYIQTWEQGTSL